MYFAAVKWHSFLRNKLVMSFFADIKTANYKLSKHLANFLKKVPLSIILNYYESLTGEVLFSVIYYNQNA